MKKIAINGFGRIGRLTLRVLLERNDMEVVAINDLADLATLAHLFKYDSSYGPYKGKVSYDATHIMVDNRPIHTYCSGNPAMLPWQELGVDIVVEATGRFLDQEGAGNHLAAGAKRVVLSAPAVDVVIPTVVVGINDIILKDVQKQPTIISNASCTTNCLAPIVKVLDDCFGIEQGVVNTIHAYTADQSLQDAPHKDLRRARAAAVSIIPTSTGAAKAIGLIIPHLNGRLDGIAMRVPVVNGSVVDFTALLKKTTTKEALNQAMLEASLGALKHILQYTEDPIVSVDVVGNTYSSVFDAKLTYVQGNFIKVVSWYDNEGAYAHRLVDLIALL
ncbi:MAG: type I glyceraldehyde-3-phosphate dehydrogenase [Amoebophilaceae bacterium]|nr:type I glyceraldehyde-3-phosphate dehydrogenase [Amoebophilaceae bacterium]